MMNPILQVSNLTKSFGGLQVTKGVNLSVHTGERHLLIGPNGAGKTSVFNTISGFYRPNAGSVHLGLEDITKAPVHARAKRGLARTFQNIALFHGLSVLENIKLGGHHTMQAGVFSALTYSKSMQEKELALRDILSSIECERFEKLNSSSCRRVVVSRNFFLQHDEDECLPL